MGSSMSGSREGAVEGARGGGHVAVVYQQRPDDGTGARPGVTDFWSIAEGDAPDGNHRATPGGSAESAQRAERSFVRASDSCFWW